MEFFGFLSPSQMRAATRILNCAYLDLKEDTDGITEDPLEVVNPYNGKRP